MHISMDVERGMSEEAYIESAIAIKVVLSNDRSCLLESFGFAELATHAENVGQLFLVKRSGTVSIEFGECHPQLLTPLVITSWLRNEQCLRWRATLVIGLFI